MVDNEMLRVRGDLFEREVRSQMGVLENPIPFLEELEEYVREPNDKVLENMLTAVANRAHVWTRILLLSKLREMGDPKWDMCEPTLRQFWWRVESVYFPGEESSLLKEKLFESIFGKENGTT